VVTAPVKRLTLAPRIWFRHSPRVQAFLGSLVLVAFAEIGDKTQLLSFVLAARLRRPAAIIAGILVATLVNHALAGEAGVWLATRIAPETLARVTGVAFLGFGLWMLRPDTLGERELVGRGAFVTAALAFFAAEMGDKTQLATVALAARYPGHLLEVVLGTTAGMLVANVPAVLVGGALAERLPLARIRLVAAALFVAMGIVTLVGGVG
jgi:putative Ca2+/H+ antiporter (TMEM165/GDT1 family)